MTDKQAMEFPTEKALKDYLHEHPDADRSKHKVKKTEKSKGKSKSRVDDDGNWADKKLPSTDLLEGGTSSPRYQDAIKDYAGKASRGDVDKKRREISKEMDKWDPGSGAYQDLKKIDMFYDLVEGEFERKKSAAVRVASRFVMASLPDAWFSREDVREVCPSCADKMASLNITQIRASVLFGQDMQKLAGLKEADKWKSLPKGWTEDSLKSFWKTMTGGKEHKITACMKKMEGKLDDPGAFCGGLASRLGER